MLNYIFSIICIYVFFGFLLYLFQRKILFNVSGPPNKPIDYGLNTVKEIHIPTSDNLSLLAWYSEPKINHPTMIYFHGNSYNIGERSNVPPIGGMIPLNIFRYGSVIDVSELTKGLVLSILGNQDKMTYTNNKNK